MYIRLNHFIDFVISQMIRGLESEAQKEITSATEHQPPAEL